MFGNSWVEAEPHEAKCPMVPSDFSSPCAAADPHVLLVCGLTEGGEKCPPTDSESNTKQWKNWLTNCVCFYACRKWRKCVQCCWIHHFWAAMNLSVRSPTWPAAPTTSACKNTGFMSACGGIFFVLIVAFDERSGRYLILRSCEVQNVTVYC